MADTLGLVSNIGQVIDLLIKLGVMCSIYCVDVKNAPQDVRKILKEADRLTATLKDLERLLCGPNGAKLESSPSLQKTVFDCRRLISEFVAKLDVGTKFARAVWPFKKKDVNEIVATLERYKATISLDLNIEQTVVLLDIHQETVISKLRVAETATFDSNMDGDESRCLPGTRTEIIEQIQQWSISPNSEPIFWLNGMAGTGKSTISRTIAQSFADNNLLGASFFFKRGEGDRGRAAFFFTTIAAQLVRQLPVLAPYIRDTLDLEPNIHEKALGDQFEKLILNPMEKASPRWQSSNLLIVVDALDECDREENMRLLVSVLSRSRELQSPRVKFFLTSRPELPIRLGFEELGGKYSGLLLAQVPKPSIERDIGLFLEHQLQTIKSDYNMSVTANRKLSQDWPGEKDIARLVTMAVPLFIVAATICRFLKDRRLGGPQNQLLGILQYQKAGSSSLDLTYLPILDRLVSGLSSSDRRGVIQKFKYTVGSIVTLATPLSVEALAQLLEVSEESLEDQLDLLHSVLSVPPDAFTPVRLLHLSFRDFLVDPEKKNEPAKYPFWVNEAETHIKLFSQSLKLLSSEGILKNDMCSLGLPGILRSDINQKRIDSCISAQVQYACSYWYYHLQSGGYRPQDDDEVHHFLSKHLLHWLEALSLLGRVSESRNIIDGLLSLVDGANSQTISRLLRDAKRFVFANLLIIQEAPLQVYCSALVFAPQNSVLKSIFSESLPSWISRLPKTNADWDTCLTTIGVPDNNVESITMSNNGKRMGSISYHSTSRRRCMNLWDVETSACLFHQYHVESMKFSPNSADFILHPQKNDIEIRASANGECIVTLSGHRGDIFSVDFSADGSQLISTASDMTVKIWDRNSGGCVASFASMGAQDARLSYDRERVFIFGSQFIQLRDMTLQTQIAHHELHDEALLSYFISPNAELIALNQNGVVRVRNFLTGEFWTMNSLAIPQNEDHRVLFLDNSRLLVLLARSVSMEIWDIRKDTCLAGLKGHKGSIKDVKLSPCKTRIASASIDKTIKLWDASTGECLVTLHGHELAVNSVDFNTDESVLVSASDDRSIKMWDTTLRYPSDNTVDRGSTTIEVIISPDGEKIITTSSDWTLRIWDAKTNRCLARDEYHFGFRVPPLVAGLDLMSAPFDHIFTSNPLNSWPRSIFFSPAGGEFAFPTAVESYLKIWDANSDSYSMVNATGPISSLSFSFLGDKLVYTTRYGGLYIAEVQTRDVIMSIEHPEFSPQSGCFSLGGDMVVSACTDGRIRVWEIPAAKCIWSAAHVSITGNPEEDGRMQSAIFSNRGDLIVSAGSPRRGVGCELKIWDFRTGNCIATCQTTGGYIPQIIFSENDSLILSILQRDDEESSLAIWDALTGRAVSESAFSRLLNHVSHFSEADRCIRSNIGTFIINHHPHFNQEIASVKKKHPYGPITLTPTGIGLNHDGTWVTWNSQQMVRLPPTYRGSCVDVRGSTVAIGTRSGSVFSMAIEEPTVMDLKHRMEKAFVVST